MEAIPNLAEGMRYMDAPLRIGIIGCGPNTHGKAWGELLAKPEGAGYGMKVVRVWDSTPEHAIALAEKTGATVVRDPVMAGEDTDGVLITEAMPFRYLELARPLLQKGLRIFLNRPFAGSVEDAREILRLADRHGARLYSASALYHTRQAATATEEIKRIQPLRLFNVTGPSDHLLWYLPHAVAAAVSVLGTGVSSVRALSMQTSLDDPHKVVEPVVVYVEYKRDAPIGPVRGTVQMIGPGASWYGFTMSLFGAHGQAQEIRFEVTYEHLLRTMAEFFRTGVEPIPRDVILEQTAILYGALASARKGGVPVDIPRLIKGE